MSKTPIEKTKFLIVDDLPENLVALDALLKRDSVEIHKALSGNEALELLLKHEFAVAFLDVQMAEMSGFELAEFMRGTERTRGIPIIFVTAGAISKQNTFKGYEAGAVDFLYKPLDPHVVRSKAGAFLELDRQRKLLRAQLQETQDALAATERAVRTRDDFLSIASHELRTPITAMGLQLQMLERAMSRDGAGNIPEERYRKVIGASVGQLRNLDKLIGSLLDVTRIANGKLALEPETVDLANLCREVLDQFSEQFLAARCEVRVSLAEGVQGSWDRQRVSQVVANLFGNAIKYGAGSLVEVMVRKAGIDAELVVKDRGMGIAKADQEKVFNRFERAVSGNAISGLGLGLHIVKEIVAAHKGSVSVESELGEGAAFRVLLPRLAEAGG